MANEKKIGFGTMDIKVEQMDDAISKAFNVGYDFIDTAGIYENEKAVGQAIIKAKTPHFKIQTKIWPDHFKNIEQQFEKQLKDLGRNRVWSLLLHRPSIDMKDTLYAWKKMIQFKKEGMVERIGVSNFDKDMINMLIKYTGVKPEINQIEFSIQNLREDRTYFSKHEGIEVQGWGCLGIHIKDMEAVKEMAVKYEVTWSDIAISFVSSQNITPIVKSSDIRRIEQNYKASNLILSSDDIIELKKLNLFANKHEETFTY